MENNNLNSRDEYNLFLFFENIWKNKLLLTLILLIFAILGVIFNYSYPYLNKATPSASINFLVTDLSTMHDILLENNPSYEFNLMYNEYGMFVIDRLNRLLS